MHYITQNEFSNDSNENDNLLKPKNSLNGSINNNSINSKKKLKLNYYSQPKEERNIIDDNFEYFPNNLLSSSTKYIEICSGCDVNDPNKLYAIKFENSIYSNTLRNEVLIYENINGLEGFPLIYHSGNNKNKNYIILERLGPNLKQLFKYCNHHFSLQTILLIGIQILNRLQDFHFKTGFTYNNINPTNFLIGITKANLIYMIDFSHAKPFRIYDYRTNKVGHISYKENLKVLNETKFSSINHHMGIELCRKDDLESLGYMLIYFANGNLPWQEENLNKDEKFKKMLEKKNSIPFEVYCKELPVEFSMYMNYVVNLGFHERPDYNYLKGLFSELLFSFYIEKFFFDWNLLTPKEIPSNLRTNKELDNKYDYAEEKEKKNLKKKEIVEKNEEEEKEEEEDEENENKENKSDEEEEEEEENEKNDKFEDEDEDDVLELNDINFDKNSFSDNESENKEINEEDKKTVTEKTDKNSLIDEEDFISIFSKISVPKNKKLTIAPNEYVKKSTISKNSKSINNKENIENNLSINNYNQNSVLDSNNESSITINNNSNSEYSNIKNNSNLNDVSLNSISSDNKSLLSSHNNSNVSLSKIKKGPNLGKLNLLKTYNFKKIKEVDDEQLTSKREKKQ